MWVRLVLMPISRGPDTRDRQARVAVAALFLTNGALFANLLPRYPEIKTDLAASNTAFGLAVAAFSAGALVSGPTAAALIRRYLSSRVVVVGTLILALFTFAAAVVPTVPLFATALFVAGAADAVTDVAQNAHGLRVQRRYGRSIFNSFHALWSMGAIVGGLMGAGAVAVGMPRAIQLGCSALIFATVAVVAYRYLLPGADHDEPHVPAAAAATASGRAGVAVYAALAALVIMAMAGAAVEDAGASWATLYLHDELGAVPAVAAFGFVALVGSQFVGRLVGDRLVDRFGQRNVARVGALIAGLGLGIALAVPTVAGTVAGFAAAGFGVATLIPAAMHAADELPGLKPGTGLTLLTWLMRAGFLASPVVVGVVADANSLRVALCTVPLACLTVVILAGVLSNARRH